MSRTIASVGGGWRSCKGAPEGGLDRGRVDSKVRACLEVLCIYETNRLRGLDQGERGIEENHHY